jgi:hypothetical protein
MFGDHRIGKTLSEHIETADLERSETRNTFFFVPSQAVRYFRIKMKLEVCCIEMRKRIFSKQRRSVFHLLFHF